VDNEIREAANRINKAGLNGTLYKSVPEGQHVGNVDNKKQLKNVKNSTDGDSLIAFLVGILVGLLSVVLLGAGIAGKIDRILWGIGSVVLFIIEIVAAKKAGKPIFQKFALINIAGLTLIIVLVLKDKAIYEWVNLQKGVQWNE